MSESVTEFEEPLGTDEAVEAPPSGKGAKIVMALFVLFALGAGGVVGKTTLGPSLGPVLADRAERAEAGGGGHGGGEGPSALHVIDNLVVNPARSGGTRFLLASIAVEATSADLTARITERDIEIRDALIMVLGAKSVEDLSDISLRLGIAGEIRVAIEKILGPGVVYKVYIPQFVIQ